MSTDRISLSKGELRRENIMRLLKLQGKVTIQEITEKFGCSEPTARRDLDLLEKQGGIIRSFGGAQLDASPIAFEASFTDKQQLLLLEKEAIARTAAAMVQQGDIVGLTGGSTTFLIARMLKQHQGITVVTNAVNIAMELSDSEGVQVVLTGGVMRRKSFELCGPLAEKVLEGLHIGKMFMGIDGFTVEAGMTTFSEQEAVIGALMLKRAATSYAVFDHTKAGKNSLFSIAPLTALKGCITDQKLPDAMTKYLKAHRIELFVAEKEQMEV
ncbi:DeoR faimly transcriptional regulator [Gordoniibacillus kamchatkensis]|uniref:DeoR faimly transcriptional regulator n=1 Tax=Gordoniibacillus kamchatkensis TaxID=1590651 RepID=A0ABR5ALN0_9BACL|nr:DeoR/GlpR family DNA-binding transcription regulator [Paenibacillus sp. VKM B-2647]KIL41955.1 DeoR faimly transcriptional regulator [Paenibacillus sp. VKM B-2647]